MNKKELIPAVIYARYSSSGQREESLTGQIRDCKAYAKRCGYSIIKEYTDAAKTGTNDHRPAFQRMIADAGKHTFKAVIVWKLDRFSRDKYDAARYKHALKQQGVKVISAMEPISESPEGVIMESLLEGMAQYYSMDLSLKVKRGNRESALEHKTVGTRLLGYVPDKDDHFAIDPKTAPIIQRIFNEYDSGKSIKDIAEELNNEGYRTRIGKPFGKSSLQHILRNERYAGVYIFGDYRADGGMPAIISKDQFNSVQDRMDKNKKKPARSRDYKYLLTGKIFCGKCGSNLIGEKARSKNKTYYHYYRDTKRLNKSCSGIRISAPLIENAIADHIYSLVTNKENLNKIADAIIAKQNKELKDDSVLKALNAQINDVQSKINNIEKAIEQGVITRTTKGRLEELESQLDALNTSRQQEIANRPEPLTKDFILFCYEEMLNGDINSSDFKEKLIDVFLESVYLYDDGTVVMKTWLPGQEKTELKLDTAKMIKDECSLLTEHCLPDRPKTNTENIAWISVFNVKGLINEHSGIARL